MAGVKLPKVKSPAQMKAEMAVGRAKEPELKTSRIDMSFKDVTKRTPELQTAAQKVAAGEMSAAEYDALVNQVKPVTPYDFVPTPATREEAVNALTSNKKEKYGAAEEWEAGTPVGLRLDIPAYSDHGVWVNSIHGPDSTAYGNVSSVTDAKFDRFDEKALKVAQGAGKSPFARIEGKWNPIEEEEAVRRASEYLTNPEWRQVGMDPERHGYFYDRKTMEPIVASEEVIQIGPLVLAKNPVYGDKADFKFAHGGVVNMSKGGAGRKIADKILPKVEAPSVMTRSELTELADYIKNREGGYGLRRVERAADEIPRLGELYTQDALRSAFSGDNAQGLVIMNPNNFEDYAVPLPLQKDIRDLHKYESQIGDPSTHFDKYSLSTNDYVRHLSGVQNKGGFDDVPYLNVFSDEVGLGLNPKIVGHEGRHRNRALAAENVPSGLVILRPSGDLREGLPRRYRDDYIDALRKEFSLVNNKVLPQTYTESNPNSFDETLIRRPPIKIAEPFANGGAVKMAEGGDAEQAEIDRMRLELSNSPVIQATPQSPFQRGIGALGGYMDQAGRFINKSIEPIAESNPVKTFIAELVGDSFKSAGTALQDYTKTSREYTEDNPYKRAPITGSGQTMSLDPRMIDVVGFADPVARLGIKGARAGVKAATPFAKDVGEMASEMYMRGDVPGMVSPNAYVIKQKGGNWLSGGIDESIDPFRMKIMGQDPAKRLKDLEDATAQNIEAGVAIDRGFVDRVRGLYAPDIAINKWIDSKLKKYVQNELATPEDPLRALAAKGISHMTDEQLDISSRWVPETLGLKRRLAGFPEENMADLTFTGERGSPAEEASQRAGGWETIADSALYSNTPDYWLQNKGDRIYDEVIKENPFLTKVPPETRVNSIGESETFAQDLGFEHLIDELKNAVRADSDLPEKLRIEPSKLEKMTVPQVVERVSEINKWRAEQQVAANLEKANNAATQVFKEYPDQGYKWVELRKPDDLTELPEGYTAEPYKSEYSEGVKIMRPDGTQASAGDTLDQALKNMSETMLDDALKYEGDTMGHCVGGYCSDVLEGSTRIYSLRDSKGQPHVTIEVQPNPNPYAITGQDFLRLSSAEKAEYGEHIRQWRRRNPDVEELTDDNIIEALRDAGVPPRPDSIIQIKGKGNAKPKDTYLPFVQDFVKSGKWSEINDFKNTGLVHAGIGGELMTPAEHAVWLASRRDAPPNGMKRGGVVRMRDGGDPEREFYDQLREGFSVYNKPTYGNEIPGTPTIDQQRYELTMKGRQEAENRARTTRDNLTAMDPSGTLGIVDALKTVGKSIVAPIAYVGGNAFDWLQTGKVDPAKSKARGEKLENWITPKTEEGGELLETIGKIPAQITGSEYGFGMHPNLWASGIGLTTPKQTAAGLRLGTERVTPFAKDVGSMASELYMSGKMPGMVSPNLYAASPDGKPSKVLAPANEIGFYSPTEAAALNLQRKSGQGQAFLNDIMKGENVKSDEISAMGLDTFLKGKTNVTADEVRDYIAQNKIQLGEATYGVAPKLKPEELERLAYLESMNRKAPLGAIDDELGEGTYTELLRLENIRDRSSVDSIYNQGEKFEQMARRYRQQGNDRLANMFWDKVSHMNARAEALDLQGAGIEKPTKFGGYQLPGGENYREIVLTLPQAPEHAEFARLNKKMNDDGLLPDDMQRWTELGSKLGEEGRRQAKEGRFKTAHWEDTNPLSHLRVSDRVTDGKKTLLVDEVQSDWHQAGRERGYAQPETARLKGEVVPDGKDMFGQGIFKVVWEDGTFSGGYNAEGAAARAAEGKSNAKEGVPDAPYKDDWYQLTLRRAIKEAVDGGYDRVALPTGSRVAERFDLSKQVDRIVVAKLKDGTFAWNAQKDGRIVQDQVAKNSSDLSLAIGKDLAKKAEAQTDIGANSIYEGNDLRVGGEGMKKYYDEIYPSYLKKLGKKYGAQSGMTKVDVNGNPEPLHYMEITPAMRKEFSTGIHMKRGGKVQFAKSLGAMRNELLKAK